MGVYASHDSILISLIFFLLILYAIVTVAVQNTRLVTEIDLNFGGWLLSKNRPGMLRLFNFLTELGTYKIIKYGTILFAGFLIIFGDWPRAILLVIIGAAATIINRYLKRIFPRIRPNFPQNYLYTVDLSYPSGHTMLATAFYGMLAYLAWVYGRGTWAGWIVFILLLVVILLIGFSRVYLGVHFVSDVIGGWIAGSLIILIGLLAGNYFLHLFHFASAV